jgi:hypothetical protein
VIKHTLCHCCGSKVCHLQKSIYGKCGYLPWLRDEILTGTFQMRHLKRIHEGITPKPKREGVAASSHLENFTD